MADALMGSLLRFPLPDEFVKRFPIFVETGYGYGRSLSYAAQHSFQHLYSIEIWPDTARQAKIDFNHDPRVRIIRGNSAYCIRSLLEGFWEPVESPMFFWLDAHFPGGEHQPDLVKDESIRLPLVDELNSIKNLRPDGNYFILVDDLRIYADGDWGDGLVPEHLHSGLPSRRNLNFLDPFRNTHRVVVDLRDSGYALIGPHGAPFLEFTE